MADIRQLSPSVVNKIAAGEVVERPASVVKELMENAVDAGALRIDVAVAVGGMELVRVSDDGCGIAPDQLALATASHATSKIAEADDLFRVRSLGFRGEALASIAAVSRLSLRSRTRDRAEGAQLDVDGGEASPVVPCGAAVGTTVEVGQLFYNTPVRRKFLRSAQTELGHVSEAFTRLALAYPHIHFTLKHNDRLIHDLAPGADWRGRVGAFFGQELARDLIAVDSADGEITLAGYVADPSHSRTHPRMQYLFLNGRAIRDRSLQHALQEAYRGLLLVGRYPIAFLRIDMPPDQVDVNVHPTKAEVRFQDSGRLYSQLLGTLRSKFLTTDLTARLQPARAGEGTATIEDSPAEAARQEVVDWAKSRLAEFVPRDPDETESVAPAAGLDVPRRYDLPHAPLSLTRLDRSWSAVDDEENDDDEEAAEAEDAAADLWSRPRGDEAQRPLAALQVHNRYLIAETEEGLLVVDQHALHERILYEALRKRVLSGQVESQSLLVPEPVDLSPAEAALAVESREVLARLGISVEPFGGGTVLVSRFPSMLAARNPAVVLRDVVELLVSTGKTPDARDVLDELLHMIACKAAVKAGDRLSPEEITALLAERHLADDAHHCPHGRPTALVFTREELDKQFKRT